MDGLHSSSFFQAFQFLYQSFGGCSNYNWYYRHSHIPQFFLVLSQVLHIYFFFRFILILFSGRPRWHSSLFWGFFFFLLTITRSGRLAENMWYVCISKSRRSLDVSFSRTYSGLRIYHLFVWYTPSEFFTSASLLRSPGLFSVF